MRVFFDTWQSMDWSILPANFQDSRIFEPKIPSVPEQKIVVTVSPQSPDIPLILLRLSWSHHIDLLSGCTSSEEKLFYQLPQVCSFIP
jgi:hypothetical protein